MSATTAIMYWQLTVPDDAELVEGNGNNGFEPRQADATSLAWEKDFIELALNMALDGISVIPFANRHIV